MGQSDLKSLRNGKVMSGESLSLLLLLLSTRGCSFWLIIVNSIESWAVSVAVAEEFRFQREL